MADIRYIGMEPAVAQVDTFTIGGTIEAGDIFILTVTALDGSTHEVSFVATDTSIATVVAGLVAAWNDDTTSYCTPATADDSQPDFTLTADTAGVAFSVALTTTESDGGAADTQTVGRVATTANAGPANWDDTGNWSGGVLPGAADDAYIEGATILYGLDQSAAGTLDSLNITQSQIGTNPADGYDPTYLDIRATIGEVNYNHGLAAVTQAGPVLLDFGNVVTTLTIHDSGIDNNNRNAPGVRVLMAAASSILVRKGRVAVAPGAGETSTVATITVGYTTQKGTDSDVLIGDGVTLTTLAQQGGDVVMRCAATTATQEAGTLRTEGDGAIGTLNVKGGNCTSNSSGTIAAANVTGKGTLDTTKSDESREITTLKVGAGAKVKLNAGVITLPNGIQLVETAGMLQISSAAA